MQFSPVFDKKKRPVLISGSCSAETESQVVETARLLSEYPIDLFRAGIWKPRTRPESFEGVGSAGLRWLQRVKKDYGLRVTTEVARAEHVHLALKYEIDVIWLGARTTANPFSVQEIADVLKGVDIPVLIKNPVNPDLKLWIGAIERIYNAGIRRIAVIHRGFSTYDTSIYRNVPRWQIPIELRRQYPGLQIICDASHICGTREYLREISQKALDLNYHGLMLESHPDPDVALSDAKQQVTPQQFGEIIRSLVIRDPDSEDPVFHDRIEDLRHQIDVIDKEIFNLLGDRMKVADQIGRFKKRNNIAILQSARWNEVLEQAKVRAKRLNLSEEFVSKMLMSIHEESINHQNAIMNEDVILEDKT